MQARSLLLSLWADYIQYVGGEVWNSTLARLFAEFGLSEDTLRQALTRMNRQGCLNARQVMGRSCYTLTRRGKLRVDEACRRIYNPVEIPWDGYWRMLTCSMPGPRRCRTHPLHRELARAGFATVAACTWISPNPLEQTIKNLVTQYGAGLLVTSFCAKHTGPETPQELVSRCWDLQLIQARYDRFIERWSPRLSEHRQAGAPADGRCLVTRIELVHDYRKSLLVDPCLPQELLPAGWRGLDARRLFSRYYDLLDPGAQRFLDEVFDPTGSLRAD